MLLLLSSLEQEGAGISTEAGARTRWFTWSGMRLLQQEEGSVCAHDESLPPDWDVGAEDLDGLHRLAQAVQAARAVANHDAQARRWQAGHSRQARCLTFLYEAADSHAPLARIAHRLDEAVGVEQARYFHTDINGAPEEMTDARGRIVWQARYRSWGNAVMEAWWPEGEDAPEDGVEEPGQNLRYQGQYLDRQTGLHYNTFRYYDPDTGRFLCQDPIGLAGGLNLYLYAPNAVQWIDPWGWARSIYEGADYHGKNDNAVKSRAPINDQTALDNSVQVKPTSPRRVGVDAVNGEIVVLDRTQKLPNGDNIFHGHVRDRDTLHADQRNALKKAGMVNRKGRTRC